MRENITGKYGPWAIVTGASNGIGQAFAEALAANGVNLILVARREDRLKQLATKLRHNFKIETQIIAADLSDTNCLMKIYDQTAGRDIGLAILAAGFGTSGSFLENKIEDELNMVDVNIRSVTAMTHHYATLFKRRGRGGLILFSSLVGFQGVPGAANYAATKAYVQSLAEGLHHELKKHNVDVLSVAPGPVRSGFADRANMRMGAADAPETVARESLKALGSGSLVRPGFLGKFLELSLKTAPRKLRVVIMGQVMKGMTQHQGPLS